MPPSDSPGQPLSDVSILYVEDDPMAVTLVRESVGHTLKALHVAENGRDGLMAFVRFHPDVVVTDVCMPKMDGLAMATAMREMSPDTPIVITTALDDPEFLRKAIRVGIDSYLIKPFTAEELLGVVSRLAIQSRHRLELEKQKRRERLRRESRKALERRVQELEEAVAREEEEIARLERRLADPVTYQGDGGAQAARDHAAAKQRLAALLAEWEDAAEVVAEQ